MTDHDNDIVAAKTGRVGHILLNRPKALNALTIEMIRVMDQMLLIWERDESVEAVVVTGAGDRAFCAGGDVKSVYFAGKAGELGRDGTLTADFFREEYTLNHRIANYRKPYVAYLDGITMGGGVGISILGSHRIVSEHTRFAMPETAIGFFPDVGGSYFMSRPGPIGALLSLTGQQLDNAAMFGLGFATHFVTRRAGAELVSRMAADGVDATLEALCQRLPESEQLGPLKALADRCFSGPTVEDVLDALSKAAKDPDTAVANLAVQTMAQLRSRSPTSLKVTLEQLQRGRQMTLADCLIMEYRISQACMQGHDFYEGIRAMLVDKDRSPKWSPDAIEKVDAELVSKHFEELGDRDLQL